MELKRNKRKQSMMVLAFDCTIQNRDERMQPSSSLECIVISPSTRRLQGTREQIKMPVGCDPHHHRSPSGFPSSLIVLPFQSLVISRKLNCAHIEQQPGRWRRMRILLFDSRISCKVASDAAGAPTHQQPMVIQSSITSSQAASRHVNCHFLIEQIMIIWGLNSDEAVLNCNPIRYR